MMFYVRYTNETESWTMNAFDVTVMPIFALE